MTGMTPKNQPVITNDAAVDAALDQASATDADSVVDGGADATRDGVRVDANGDALAANIRGDRRVPFTPANDVQFIDFFIRHHEMAIQMSTMVIERGARMDVKTLAQNIRDEQSSEIAIMKTARQELVSSAEPPPPPPDGHAARDMAMMMALSGQELDRRFLLEMIGHHASGRLQRIGRYRI